MSLVMDSPAPVGQSVGIYWIVAGKMYVPTISAPWTFPELSLDANISKKALNFFLEILIKIPKFLQNLL